MDSLPSSAPPHLSDDVVDPLAIEKIIFLVSQLVLYFGPEHDKIAGLEKSKVLEKMHFLEPFEDETDLVQANKEPIFQIPVLSYHRLKDHSTATADDSDMIRSLKVRANRLLDQKLQPELTIRHKVATFPGPSYRKLKMLSEDDRQMVRILLYTIVLLSFALHFVVSCIVGIRLPIMSRVKRAI